MEGRKMLTVDESFKATTKAFNLNVKECGNSDFAKNVQNLSSTLLEVMNAPKKSELLGSLLRLNKAIKELNNEASKLTGGMSKDDTKACKLAKAYIEKVVENKDTWLGKIPTDVDKAIKEMKEKAKEQPEKNKKKIVKTKESKSGGILASGIKKVIGSSNPRAKAVEILTTTQSALDNLLKTAAKPQVITGNKK